VSGTPYHVQYTINLFKTPTNVQHIHQHITKISLTHYQHITNTLPVLSDTQTNLSAYRHHTSPTFHQHKPTYSHHKISQTHHQHIINTSHQHKSTDSHHNTSSPTRHQHITKTSPTHHPHTPHTHYNRHKSTHQLMDLFTSCANIVLNLFWTHWCCCVLRCQWWQW
jgi:hypothetical protein